MTKIKLLVSLALLFSGLMAVCQEKPKSKFGGILIVQGIMTKFNDVDPVYGGSFSMGVKYMNVVGLSFNMQVMKFKNDKNGFTPANLELSLTAPKGGVRPFCNLQAGLANYHNNYQFNTTYTSIHSETKGGLFLSPGAGVVLPIKNQTGLILTISYVSANLSTNTSTTTTTSGRSNTVKSSSSNNLQGFRVGVGVKLS